MNFSAFPLQIGMNNCTARYRSFNVGGRGGESPSPTQSSDYEDDNNLTAASQHNGLPINSNLNNMKMKRNNLSGMRQGSTISQKATVHYVSIHTYPCSSFVMSLSCPAS